MSKKETAVIVGALLAVILVFKLIMDSATGTATGSGKPPPDIALPLQKGAAPTQLSALKGKVVLLDFWATWCGPCRMSMPELERLYEKFKDQGLVVIGIATDSPNSQGAIPETLQSLHITYPIVLADDIPDIREKYRFESIPQLFTVDRRGNRSEHFEGFDPNSKLEDLVVKLLKQ